MAESSSLEVANVTDFRSSERTRSIYRPALIETDGFSSFCMVRNLSAMGMKADAYAELNVGQQVVVELSHIQRVEGEIIWSDGSNVGVKFDHPIDVATVLTGIEGASGDTCQRRPPRLSIGCTARIFTERGEIPSWVSDVSQRGVKVAISGVAKGEELAVHLPFHSVKKAIVRWTQHGVAGLNFVAPMKYSELAEWAIRVQEERHNGQTNPLREQFGEIRRSA